MPTTHSDEVLSLQGAQHLAPSGSLKNSALRKYFREVANLSWSVKKVPRPRKEERLPMILSKQDVQTIIEHAVNYKHQVFLTFVYATGLRLSEALNENLII